jgi:hypothetical protein
MSGILDHARALDPGLRRLALKAARESEPLDPRRLPGARSIRGRNKYFWRADDCKPVHPSHRVRAA